MLNNTFQGEQYRLANNWFQHVNLDEFQNRPIRYLEIGTFYGANLLSVANTYGKHAESKLYCVDPWEYDECVTYCGKGETIYGTFLENVENSGSKERIVINRGYSNIKVPTFEDEFFDMIYIDGNHEPEYVLEDAVLCFRKLKRGGIMIFDDYGWGGPDLTQRGIDAFLNGYYKKIQNLGMRSSQVFVRKL